MLFTDIAYDLYTVYTCSSPTDGFESLSYNIQMPIKYSFTNIEYQLQRKVYSLSLSSINTVVLGCVKNILSGAGAMRVSRDSPNHSNSGSTTKSSNAWRGIVRYCVPCVNTRKMLRGR